MAGKADVNIKNDKEIGQLSDYRSKGGFCSPDPDPLGKAQDKSAVPLGDDIQRGC